jgi:hypothetical protein
MFNLVFVFVASAVNSPMAALHKAFSDHEIVPENSVFMLI